MLNKASPPNVERTIDQGLAVAEADKSRDKGNRRQFPWILVGPRRTVGKTRVLHGGFNAEISTMFLATLGDEPAWETTVSGGPLGECRTRYTSQAAALRGHRLHVIHHLLLAGHVNATRRKRRLCDRYGHPRTIEASDQTALCLRCGRLARIPKVRALATFAQNALVQRAAKDDWSPGSLVG